MVLTRQKQPQQSKHPLSGRYLHIPRMSDGGAEAMAAAFRSLGVKARVSPQSDDETLALAARFTTGEECLPQRVTLGNFLKIILSGDFNPSEHAFLMPTSAGPCRFGQYAPLLTKILRDLNMQDALVFSPTSSDGYEGFAANVIHFHRTAWRAIVVSDLLRQLLLMFRPYEKNKGETDRVHRESLDIVCNILSDGSLSLRQQMKKLVAILKVICERFDNIPLAVENGSRPLIGAVGEIYLRFNEFSNQDILRKIEAQGGETWIAPISEWVWYTNAEEKRKLQEKGKRFSSAMLKARIKHWIQKQDERKLKSPLKTILSKRHEPAVEMLLKYSWPYLPANKALGEMTLNVGNAIAYHKAGCDGVVDISPFTCMNGIVTEVIYSQVSKDHNNLPIRIFYFDGVPIDLEGDLEIFMEQVKSYRKKRLKTR